MVLNIQAFCLRPWRHSPGYLPPCSPFKNQLLSQQVRLGSPRWTSPIYVWCWLTHNSTSPNHLHSLCISLFLLMPYAPLSSILLASVYLHTPSRHQSCGDLSLYIFNLSKPFYKACQLIMIIILENSLSLQFSWQKQVNVSTVYCLLNPLYLQGS